MKPNASTWLGLALALAGPGAVAFLSQPPASEPFTVGTSVIWLSVFAALIVAVCAIAFIGEKLHWADVGFGRVSWRSIPLAVALALFFILVFGPVAVWLLAESGPGGFEAGENRLAALPAWYLCLTVVVVAGGEEWLYRGYAMERLWAVAGNAWIAGGISLLAAVLVHLPMWGIGPSLMTLFPGAIVTVLYIWRRDVSSLILAHVATDLYGLAIAPRL